MSYDNAEPKILKTLNSSGQVLDDSGNVISDTTDYWEKFYEQAEPKPDKILHSDGTIKDSAGNVIQDTTEFNVKKYNQAEPIPAKYLHTDGTIDENPGSGSSGVTTLYCWVDNQHIMWVYTTTETPTTSNKALFSEDNTSVMELITITEVTEEGIKTSYNYELLSRYSNGDISLT